MKTWKGMDEGIDTWGRALTAGYERVGADSSSYGGWNSQRDGGVSGSCGGMRSEWHLVQPPLPPPPAPRRGHKGIVSTWTKQAAPVCWGGGRRPPADRRGLRPPHLAPPPPLAGGGWRPLPLAARWRPSGSCCLTTGRRRLSDQQISMSPKQVTHPSCLRSRVCGEEIRGRPGGSAELFICREEISSGQGGAAMRPGLARFDARTGCRRPSPSAAAGRIGIFGSGVGNTRP